MVWAQLSGTIFVTCERYPVGRGKLFEHAMGAIFTRKDGRLPKSTTEAKSQFSYDTNSIFAIDKRI